MGEGAGARFEASSVAGLAALGRLTEVSGGVHGAPAASIAAPGGVRSGGTARGGAGRYIRADLPWRVP